MDSEELTERQQHARGWICIILADSSGEADKKNLYIPAREVEQR